MIKAVMMQLTRTNDKCCIANAMKVISTVSKGKSAASNAGVKKMHPPSIVIIANKSDKDKPVNQGRKVRDKYIMMYESQTCTLFNYHKGTLLSIDLIVTFYKMDIR